MAFTPSLLHKQANSRFVLLLSVHRQQETVRQHLPPRFDQNDGPKFVSGGFVPKEDDVFIK